VKSLQDVSLTELCARRPRSIESKARAAQATPLRKKVGQQELDETFRRHAEHGRASQGEAKHIELVEGYRGMGLSKKEAGLAADLELAFERFLPEKRQWPAKLMQQGSNSGSAQQKMEEAFTAARPATT
jgi:hypothetical protein